MLFESHVGNLVVAMAVCLLNSNEGQQPGETVLITPIVASVLAPRKVSCVLLLGFASGCWGLSAAFGVCGGLQGLSERPFNMAQLLGAPVMVGESSNPRGLRG